MAPRSKAPFFHRITVKRDQPDSSGVPSQNQAGILVVVHDQIALRLKAHYWIYCAAIAALVLAPKLAILVFADLLEGDLSQTDQLVQERAASSLVLIVMVLIAPLLETGLLWVIGTVIQRMIRNWTATILLSALLLTALHYGESPIRLIATLWAFIVYATAVFARHVWSPKRAFFAGVVAHAIQNLIAVAGILAMTYGSSST